MSTLIVAQDRKSQFYFAVDQAGIEKVLKVVSAFMNLPHATKVLRAERHPAFQTLLRSKQNQIHRGDLKSLCWFIHRLLDALEDIHGLEHPNSMGSVRIRESTSQLRDLSCRKSARQARLRERSEVGPSNEGRARQMVR